MLPLIFTFMASAALFGVLGLVVLTVLRVRRGRGGALVEFVVAAQAGALLFALAYSWLLADGTGELRSTGSVLGLLVGMLAAGVAIGPAAVRRFAARRARRR